MLRNEERKWTEETLIMAEVASARLSLSSPVVLYSLTHSVTLVGVVVVVTAGEARWRDLILLLELEIIHPDNWAIKWSQIQENSQ